MGSSITQGTPTTRETHKVPQDIVKYSLDPDPPRKLMLETREDRSYKLVAQESLLRWGAGILICAALPLAERAILTAPLDYASHGTCDNRFFPYMEKILMLMANSAHIWARSQEITLSLMLKRRFSSKLLWNSCLCSFHLIIFEISHFIISDFYLPCLRLSPCLAKISGVC